MTTGYKFYDGDSEIYHTKRRGNALILIHSKTGKAIAAVSENQVLMGSQVTLTVEATGSREFAILNNGKKSKVEIKGKRQAIVVRVS